MSSSTKSKVPLIVAAIVGVLLVLGVRQLFSGSDAGNNGAGNTDTSGCTQVTVAASSEKAALLSELATEYNDEGRQVDGNCVAVTVNSKASGGAAQALARGWREDVDGPLPTVWTPASSSWAVIVQQDLAAADKPDIIPTSRDSIAQTPLVIAMPRPMAEALGWPDKQIGWRDLAELAKSPKGWAEKNHPEWGRFKLGKTNPYYSTSGLNATIASYYAATGLASDLTLKDLRNPKTQEFVRNLESSVVHYGDTTLTFLSNMANEAARGQGLTYVSAVTVEEKSVLDYNRGNPTGNPATLGQEPPPSVPLAAVYPSDGTLISDNPWLVLDATWVSPEQKAAAADFLQWVREPDQQRRFTEAGFRTFEGVPGDVIRPEDGMLPAGAKTVLSPPAPNVLAALQQSWDTLRKRAHVLMVMDVSGSMGEPVPSAGANKLQLAQQAAIGALDGFAPDDQVGLWVFSTGQGDNGEPYRQLVPIGPAKDTVPVMKRDIAELLADGGTGLYATLREAQKESLKTLDTERINAIVLLSDGRNEYPPDTDLDGLLDQLGAESVDTSVRVFTIGYGEAADTEALERIAEASRGQYYEANDPTSIEKVLTSVLSNF
ncbi:MAG: substrate-binding and VWA domain-containing protein [Candidatus Nanopelagicales bacterium]